MTTQLETLIVNWNLELDLHEVVRRNEILKIEHFLSLGCNVNEKNSDGRTPLHEAVCENIGNSHQEAINLLLNSGADVNAQDKTGYTALHYMAANNSSFSRTIFDLFFKFNARIEVKNDQGETAFFTSVESGNLDMAQHLMGRGANVTQRRTDRRTPLHSASFNCDEKMIKFLIDNGADVHAKSIVGLTPLHDASRSNKNNLQKAIRLLLNNGAHVNKRDSYSNTALHYMAKKKNGFSKTILDLLIQFNASIDVGNKQREAPLFLAVQSGNFEMAQLLMERGVNVNRRNRKGYTALHNACVLRDIKMIEFLMENEADLNVRDSKGRAPLELFNCENFSEKREYEKIFRRLLDFSDITNNTFPSYLKNGDFLMIEPTLKILFEQIAKLQTLNIPVHSSFLKVLSKTKPPNTEYFNKCTEELLIVKSSKLKNSWVTFFNLLVDDEHKLKNYAGNQDLVEDFNQTDCLKKFPIYGDAMQKNMEKAIETRNLFDESAEKLSDCCPVFNPNHLIIRNVLDCLKSEDYKNFVFDFCKTELE